MEGWKEPASFCWVKSICYKVGGGSQLNISAGDVRRKGESMVLVGMSVHVGKLFAFLDEVSHSRRRVERAKGGRKESLFKGFKRTHAMAAERRGGGRNNYRRREVIKKRPPKEVWRGE